MDPRESLVEMHGREEGLQRRLEMLMEAIVGSILAGQSIQLYHDSQHVPQGSRKGIELPPEVSTIFWLFCCQKDQSRVAQ